MISRIIVVLMGIPLVYFLLSHGNLVCAVFFSVISIIGQYELFSMFRIDEQRHPVLEYGCACLILAGTYLRGEEGLLLGFAISGIFLASFIVLRGLRGDGYKRFSLGVASLVYLPFCLSFFLLLEKVKGSGELFVVLTLVWSLDIGAYAVGMPLRGPLLAPLISPKKTIAGAIGGTVSCVCAVFLANYFGYFLIPQWKILLFGLSISIIGQIADLFESVLKREAGIKDSGVIFGNHGGMLDRLDSVLFLGPISYIFLVK